MANEPVVLVLWLPAVVAVVPFTDSAPVVGAVLSAWKPMVRFTVLPAASRPTIVRVPGVEAAAVQLNGLEVYVIVGALPVPVVTVSALCVQPVVAIAGNVAEAGPAPVSVTVAAMRSDPATAE